ncbi:NAD(P)-dependent alcohol dehydrogenase [Pseudomonas viridiflava]|uniref:NAD(P)-dependent alcohol dehydrogenase n=1 Tax=Pseudomonas viridiflava TaxID=33069 RepID=UPI0015E43327|nr:NAD(P)-dependent alcohol dehydrogenase [Pseudomonas viridiflava]MBA1228176.1 NAD(P)-dependent alcohol dehydrogenase [Pseudomonas viridiflava]
MKRIQYGKYGGPELMRIEDFELCAPAKDEVAIQVRHAAINPIDWKLRNGVMKIVTGNTFPRGMGMDFSGAVIAVGPDVTRFKPGDAVLGLARFKKTGAFAQAVVTKEAFLAIKPESLSFEDAACIGTPGITAWNSLVDKAKLQAGQHVFINGCSGAVGEAAVQIARYFGATVSGSCSAKDIDRSKALGVQTVYDYRITPVSAIKTRFDAVLDTAAALSVSQGLAMLRPSGVFLDLNPGPGKFIRALFDRRLKPIIASPRVEILDKLAEAASRGRFKIPVGEVVPLSGAINLITDIEQGRKLGGKGVIAME